MISVTFFTTIFIIVISLACVEPWTIPSETSRGRNIRETSIERESHECVYTYKAYQPNMDFFKEKVAEITVDKCNEDLAGRKKKKRNRKRDSSKVKKGKKDQRKKKNNRRGKKSLDSPKKIKIKKNSKGSGRKQRNKKKRKNKKIFRELKTFRKWKSLMSQRKLLSQPVGQKAVSDLWSGLIDSGPPWKEIFQDMHQSSSESSDPSLSTSPV